MSLYSAEQIINWRVERVNGRNVPVMIVLMEQVAETEHTSPRPSPQSGEGASASSRRRLQDEFELALQQQIRVLKLVPQEDGDQGRRGSRPYQYVVEIWREKEALRTARATGRRKKIEWELVETKTPLRLGKPLPLIPFVFHGPRHSRPDVDRPPLQDIIAVNLDHYRLDADYKHGMHYTALPTAWVSGFDKSATLRIGSSTAWCSETVGATAGYLEFTGQGLTTFERAMDRDERLMALLGSRLLEDQKKVGETAEAIRLRQSGEESVLSGIATSVSESLTQVLHWVYWWHSHDLRNHRLGIAGQRRPQHVGIIEKPSQRPPHPCSVRCPQRTALRNFHKRRPPKDQPNKPLGAPRRRVKERRSLLIGKKLFLGLRIQPRQILLAAGLDRILTGQDITSSRPISGIGIIIGMCRVDRHISSMPDNSSTTIREAVPLLGASISWRAWVAN